MKITKGTVIRTICLVLALANQTLSVFNKNPLPFSDDEVYEAVSVLMTVCASLIAWWKNNSFTHKAIYADSILHSGE